MTRASAEEAAIYERLLDAKLAIFEAYASGAREPLTPRAKRFVEVCAGRERAKTPSERAYLYYRCKVGCPIIHVGNRLPPKLHTAPHELGQVLDNAVENMASWKPWHE